MADIQQLDSEETLYHTINLLNQGLSFVDILYTFGRYYLKTHEFIVDFNIVQARHLGHLYQCIKSLLIKNKWLWGNEMKL